MAEQYDKGPTEGPATFARRELLGAAGKAAVVGVTAAAAAGVSSAARSAESQVGEECMTIVYRNAPDARFDFEYYEKTHMPLIMERYGASISRFELRRGQPGADGAAPPFIATVSIWIADSEAFDRAAAQYQAAIRDDVTKFTNAELVAQRDRIVGITSS
jgi:uncharacterized protein (TIGR02118 family)